MPRPVFAMTLPSAALYVMMLECIRLALVIVGACATMFWLNHIRDGR